MSTTTSVPPVTTRALAAFYSANRAMQASPFTYAGGADGPLLDEVLGSLGISLRGRTVADVGGGSGDLGAYCRFRGAAYVGMDIIPPKRRELTVEQPPFVVGDGQSLPLRDASVDVVMVVDSFEHLPDQYAAAREFRRVLRPGGQVFLSIPNYSNVTGLVKLFQERTGRARRHTWAPFCGWHPEELEQFMTPWRVRRIFKTAGFRNLRMRGHDIEFLIGQFPWAWLGSNPYHPVTRLQYWRRARSVWRLAARALPHLSLHNFWAIDA